MAEQKKQVCFYESDLKKLGIEFGKGVSSKIRVKLGLPATIKTSTRTRLITKLGAEQDISQKDLMELAISKIN